MKLGIIGAMDVEVATLKSKRKDPVVTTRAAMAYYEGILEGTPAVVVQCGVGKVNADQEYRLLYFPSAQPRYSRPSASRMG